MEVLVVSVLLVAIAVSGTDGAMSLSKLTANITETEASFTGTVFNAEDTRLDWIVDSEHVVRAFIDTSFTGSPTLDDPVFNETFYGYTSSVTGMNVTTTFTIKHPSKFGVVTLAVGEMNETYEIPSTAAVTVADTTTPGATVPSTVTGIEATGAPNTTDSTEAMDGTTKAPTTMTDEITPSATTTISQNITTIPDCDIYGEKCARAANNMSYATEFYCTRDVVTMESCTVMWWCINGTYGSPSISCDGHHACLSPGVWGNDCTKLCGGGCDTLSNTSGIHICNATNGKCLSRATKAETSECAPGYDGDNCEIPRCEQGCGGGVCLAPNHCGNCPRHYESGRTCRNISLDGFAKGSLPTLAILAAVVIALKIGADCYERTKKKSA